MAPLAADKNGAEHESNFRLRTLISEGRFTYSVTIKTAEGNFKTEDVVKNGPIALLVSSARDNVEPELMSRLMLIDSDESEEQTAAVVDRRLDSAKGLPSVSKSGTTLDLWRDYQRWLELGGPYDVVIPFADAIRVAFIDLEKKLRTRRDVVGILTAVCASAIAHRAQRNVDCEGRIEAQISDYAWAFRAFHPGLKSFYRPQASRGVQAIVAALKKLFDASERKRAKAVLDHKAKNPKSDVTPVELEAKDYMEASYAQIGEELGFTSKTLSPSASRKPSPPG